MQNYIASKLKENFLMIPCICNLSNILVRVYTLEIMPNQKAPSSIGEIMFLQNLASRCAGKQKCKFCLMPQTSLSPGYHFLSVLR